MRTWDSLAAFRALALAVSADRGGGLNLDDDFKYFSVHVGGHLGFWGPDCNNNFSNGFTALDNTYKMVLGPSRLNVKYFSGHFGGHFGFW